MQSKLKMVIEYLNPAVQYVLMCDFCCFFHLLSPLVSLFSDCYGGWQMWPVAIFVGTIYFKTYLSRPVYVCKLPVVNPSSDPCQPSSHLTLSGNDSKEQSLFCSTHPPNHQTCSDVATTCLSAKVMLYLAET